MIGTFVPRFQEERPYLDGVHWTGLDREGKPEGWVDRQVRIYRGRWKIDVGFHLMPDPTGFEVTFGCWMASTKSGVKERFGRWARDESGDIRTAVLAADKRLREFGMSVMLLVASRTDHYDPPMRRRPSSEEEWGDWAQNEPV